MARFFKGDAAEVSPYAACCYAIFFKLLIPAIARRFISGDEEHGDTPATRLSGNAETFAVMPHARRK
jgi:hypothetical protein